MIQHDSTPKKNPGISHGIPQIQWHLSFPIQVADRPASPVIGSSARPGATGATEAQYFYHRKMVVKNMLKKSNIKGFDMI